MLSVICLILGTISVVLFIFMMMKGQKYGRLAEGLSEEEFQLKDIYTVGFAWTEMFPRLGHAGSFGIKRLAHTVFLDIDFPDFLFREILCARCQFGLKICHCDSPFRFGQAPKHFALELKKGCSILPMLNRDTCQLLPFL